MTEWRVNVQGDDLDLEQLAVFLTSPRQQVRKEEGHFVLTSDRFDTCTDADTVRKIATGVLDTLFGLARLRFGARIPFAVGNLRCVKDNGRTDYYVLLEGASLTVRGGPTLVKMGSTGISEAVQPQDPMVERALMLESDELISRVLRLYGKAVKVWKDLYPIYEIVEQDVGGENSLVAKGWTSGNQITQFTRTAGQSNAMGYKAMDGVSNVEPPPNPMT